MCVCLYSRLSQGNPLGVSSNTYLWTHTTNYICNSTTFVTGQHASELSWVSCPCWSFYWVLGWCCTLIAIQCVLLYRLIWPCLQDLALMRCKHGTMKSRIQDTASLNQVFTIITSSDFGCGCGSCLICVILLSDLTCIRISLI